MDTTLLLCSLAIIGLILHQFKWVIKSEIFHPAFLYALVNGGFFLVFVFGPYNYRLKIDDIYYVMYVLVMVTYIMGIAWGGRIGGKRMTKELKLKPFQLSILYWGLTAYLLGTIILPTIFALGDRGLLESAVNNRFEAAAAMKDNNNSNPILFLFTSFSQSFIQLSFAAIAASAIYRRQKYHRIVVVLIAVILLGMIYNSRTTLLFGLNTILIPLFLNLKDKGVIDFQKIKKIIKNIPMMVLILTATIFLIFLLTNVRAMVQQKSLSSSLGMIEHIYKAERRDSFQVVAQALPDSITTPIFQISLYAGGTVAFGGVATEIVNNTDLHTWGTRSLNPVHRILDRSGLDGGFAENAKNTYRSILARGPGGFEFSWWGDPANLIVDYGYIGALLASFCFGAIIGWIYARVSNGGLVIKSIGNVLLCNSMILSPAVGPFSYFPSAIALMLLITYLLKSSMKKRAYMTAVTLYPTDKKTML